jgi:molybdopterin-containing oxidoreductase family iron-sulfur binding subunit
MPNLKRSRTPSPAPAKQRRWAMVVDLNVCTGCAACAVACRAENNVAIAGPKEAARNGTLQWIRIERNWEGAGDDFRVASRPISCQQCDDAPCEPVCPVLATYTDAEGLSVQVYNRCVGVRYCALNCPYEERFFNWFDYQWPESMELQLNPDVSRRTRGIMEKCSFCVQRILAAERDAKRDGREIQDGDVQPACVQSCPAQALIFGDLNDPKSRIAQVWGNPGLETLLGDLGTRPKVRYARRGDVLGARALDPDTEGAA